LRRGFPDFTFTLAVLLSTALLATLLAALLLLAGLLLSASTLLATLLLTTLLLLAGLLVWILIHYLSSPMVKKRQRSACASWQKTMRGRTIRSRSNPRSSLKKCVWNPPRMTSSFSATRRNNVGRCSLLWLLGLPNLILVLIWIFGGLYESTSLAPGFDHISATEKAAHQPYRLDLVTRSRRGVAALAMPC
jgi:hypothetical protein